MCRADVQKAAAEVVVAFVRVTRCLEKQQGTGLRRGPRAKERFWQRRQHGSSLQLHPLANSSVCARPSLYDHGFTLLVAKQATSHGITSYRLLECLTRRRVPQRSWRAY